MFWRSVLGQSVALSGLLGSAHAVDFNPEDCPDGGLLIEHQPVTVIYNGNPPATSETTITRTATIPPTVPTYDRATSYYDGPPFTTTIPGTGGRPGTIVEYVPNTYVSTTRIVNGPPRTYTIPPSGTVPGTVVVEKSAAPPPYVTYTTTGSIETTQSFPPDGTNPGSYVVIKTPPGGGYYTSTERYTGSTPITGPITSTRPPSSPGEPTGIIILTPPPDVPYVTVTTTGSVPTTRTIPATGTEPPTVEIVVTGPPPEIPYVTTTEPYTGNTPITGPITSTRPPSEPGRPTEIVILTPGPPTSPSPTSNVSVPPLDTTTEPYDGPTPITGPITFTRTPTGTITSPVVVVQTPSSSSSSSSAEPTTSPEPSYVSTTQPYTGTETTTRTVPPSGTQPGTIVVETPACTPGLLWGFYDFQRSDTVVAPGQIPERPDADSGTTYSHDTLQVRTLQDGQTPSVTGTTRYFGFPSSCDDTNAVIYGQDTQTGPEYNTVMHTGYFRPNQAGRYTFSGQDLDEMVYLWIGNKAFSSWENSNADLIAEFTRPNDNVFSYDVPASSVDGFIPYRILFVNAQRCAQFTMEVKDPQGNVIASSDVESTDGQFVSQCGPPVNQPPIGF